VLRGLMPSDANIKTATTLNLIIAGRENMGFLTEKDFLGAGEHPFGRNAVTIGKQVSPVNNSVTLNFTGTPINFHPRVRNANRESQL